MLVMPTRRSPWHNMLSRVLCHLHPLQRSYDSIVLFRSHGGEGSATPTPLPPHKHFYCFALTSREPKNTVFQQNPTVQQAQLDAPMDSDAVFAAAQSSIHLSKEVFSVCRDLAALRRNPIRSTASRDPISKKSREKSMFLSAFSPQRITNYPGAQQQSWRGRGSAPPHTTPTSQNTSIASILPPQSQKTQFFSKIRHSCTHNSMLRWTQTL